MSSSGLAGLLTDTREFLAAVRFARPELLWLLLILPLLALVNRYAVIRRSRAASALGNPSALAALRTVPHSRHWQFGAAYLLAWGALVLALAGPRWGKSDETGVAVGRDVVLVVDLSQSMRAEDMANAEARSRWKAARAASLDLVDAASRRGGHRLAVLVFAARPKLLVPLTTDYDHVRAVIEDIDGDTPPPDIRPGADPTLTSGTRIGAALIAAVEAQDVRFPGARDIVLLSDGDDPGDDEEWRRGAVAARNAAIPVDVVGLGDPDHPAPIVVGDQNAEFVSTKLEEEPLKQIAAETRGQYLPARREVPHLGEFFRAVIEPRPARTVSDDSLPQPKEHYAGFLAASLILFGLSGWKRNTG